MGHQMSYVVWDNPYAKANCPKALDTVKEFVKSIKVVHREFLEQALSAKSVYAWQAEAIRIELENRDEALKLLNAAL